VESKLDQIIETLTDIRVTLADHSHIMQRNTEDLAEHIRRTNILETRQEAHGKDLQEALLPIKALKFVGSLIIGISAVTAAIYGLIQLI